MLTRQRLLRNLFLGLVLAWLALVGFAVSARAWEAELVRVVDGDTLIVTLRNVRVRLYGIDAPERDQPGGAAASAFLQNLLQAGDRLDVEPRGGLNHGRLVGIVRRELAAHSDSLTLNEELLRAGQAWIDLRYCRSAVCRDWQKREAAARRAGQGLWRDAAPFSPWDWRRMKERQKN